MDDNIPFVVKQLCCFRQKIIFSDICFELQRGEMLLITGENGVGKSSLLRLLAGISSPYSGDISWYGKTIDSLESSYHNQFHYLDHLNGLKLNLTVAENLSLIQHLQLTSITDNETVLRKLNLLNYKHSLTKYLSAGQKRRLGLAKLFLMNKNLWLLDEPLTSLDVNTQEFFLLQLKQHLTSGGICILSSHQPITLPKYTYKILRMTTC